METKYPRPEVCGKAILFFMNESAMELLKDILDLNIARILLSMQYRLLELCRIATMPYICQKIMVAS